jgi:hypothetical protein
LFSLQEHLSLFEVTCCCQSGDRTLSLHTAARSAALLPPLQVRFGGDSEAEEWQADIVNGE